jgi:molecular chaperone HtpG
VQFHALLYVPDKAPFDLFHKDRRGLRLYAKRVLIMEDCDKLTPIWLRFLRGVVDSEDLSLNVSREMLQNDKVLEQIEQQIVKSVLKTLQTMRDEDVERYDRLWREFGRVLKEGITLDWRRKDELADLCRFESLKTESGKLISLKDYVAAMPDDQKDIWYLTGPSRAHVERSPQLEVFRKRGIDVIFMTDPIDEWVVKSLGEFDKRRLRSVVHGDVEVGEEHDAKADAAVAAIKKALGDRVKDVRPSKRLTESASCLVADEGEPGANLERIMRMVDQTSKESKRILEINASHPFVKNLEVLAARDPESSKVAGFAEMLLDQALLAEGVVKDPAALVKRLDELLVEVSARAVS